MSKSPPPALRLDEASILLHVGLHKCGSTWLQQRMFDNEEIGFSSPWGRMSAMAVTEFVTVEPLAFDAAETRRRLEAAAALRSEASVLIFSHEALSSRPHHGGYYAPQVAERLKAVFGDARVLLIFREQKALIYSLYGEALRNGSRASLREFIGTGAEPPGFTALCQLSFFEYDRLINFYRGVFGEDGVLALPLEMLAGEPETFVRSICAFAGVSYCPLATEEKVNTAWKPLTYQLLRHSNALLPGNRLKPRTGPAFRIRRRVLNGLDRIIPQGMQNRLGADQKKMIEARVGTRYRQSNARLSEILSLDLGRYGYDI